MSEKIVVMYRHAEKEGSALTVQGRQDALNEGRKLRNAFSYFKCHATEVERAKETVKLLAQGSDLSIPSNPTNDHLRVNFTEEQGQRFAKAEQKESNKTALQAGFDLLPKEMFQWSRGIAKFIDSITTNDVHIAVSHTPLPESFMYLMALGTKNIPVGIKIWNQLSFAPLDRFILLVDYGFVHIKSSNISFLFQHSATFEDICNVGISKHNMLMKEV